MQSSWVRNLNLPHSVTILTEILFHSFLYWSVRKIHVKSLWCSSQQRARTTHIRHWRICYNAFTEKFNTVFLFSLAKQLLDSGLQTEKMMSLSLIQRLISRKDVQLIIQGFFLPNTWYIRTNLKILEWDITSSHALVPGDFTQLRASSH